MFQANHSLHYEKLSTQRYILLYQPVEQDFLQLLDEQISGYLTRFEQTYSRFRADSVLAQLAIHWYIDNPSEELVSMLEFAINIEDNSNGYFSVLLADTLTSQWYWHHIPADNHGTEKAIVPLRSVLTISPTRITLEPWYRLDFGGFGKWRAVDAVANILQNNGITYALVNGWGDIRILDNTVWYDIVLEDPLHEDKSIGTVHLTSGWCAASSPRRRQRKKDGQTHHHLIDPHTKKSVISDRLAVHTYASNARMADVASTILYVCPPDQIAPLLWQLSIACLIILEDYSTIQSPWYPKIIAS